MLKIDNIDIKILDQLEKDGRISYTDLAKKVGLTSTAVGQRMQKMTQERLILGFAAKVNKKELGITIQAIINLKLNFTKIDALYKVLNSFEEIESCYRVTGEDCLIMKVNFRDNTHMVNFINRISDYGFTKSSIILEQLI